MDKDKIIKDLKKLYDNKKGTLVNSESQIYTSLKLTREERIKFAYVAQYLDTNRTQLLKTFIENNFDKLPDKDIKLKNIEKIIETNLDLIDSKNLGINLIK